MPLKKQRQEANEVPYLPFRGALGNTKPDPSVLYKRSASSGEFAYKSVPILVVWSPFLEHRNELSQRERASNEGTDLAALVSGELAFGHARPAVLRRSSRPGRHRLSALARTVRPLVGLPVPMSPDAQGFRSEAQGSSSYTGRAAITTVTGWELVLWTNAESAHL